MQSTQVKYISLLSNSIKKTTDFPSRDHALNYPNPFPKHAVLFHSHLHLQKPIVSAYWKKQRPSGSVRTTKIILQSAYFIASKFKIFPEPLDAILREFGGGNGGGGGGGLRFGWGNGWGGFDGRRRKKVNLGFGAVFFVILGVGLWLILRKRLEPDVFWGFLGVTLFGFSVNVWKRGVLDWALGYCCCAALVGLLLKEDLSKKWVGLFGSIKIARRRRKRRLF